MLTENWDTLSSLTAIFVSKVTFHLYVKLVKASPVFTKHDRQDATQNHCIWRSFPLFWKITGKESIVCRKLPFGGQYSYSASRDAKQVSGFKCRRKLRPKDQNVSHQEIKWSASGWSFRRYCLFLFDYRCCSGSFSGGPKKWVCGSLDTVK